jgi:hypothetical protein
MSPTKASLKVTSREIEQESDDYDSNGYEKKPKAVSRNLKGVETMKTRSMSKREMKVRMKNDLIEVRNEFDGLDMNSSELSDGMEKEKTKSKSRRIEKKSKRVEKFVDSEYSETESGSDCDDLSDRRQKLEIIRRTWNSIATLKFEKINEAQYAKWSFRIRNKLKTLQLEPFLESKVSEISHRSEFITAFPGLSSIEYGDGHYISRAF